MAKSLLKMSSTLSRLVPYNWTTVSQGLEILSSSRDLLSLPVEDDVGCCSLIGTRRISSTKMAGTNACASRASSAYTATCKPCDKLALWLSQLLRF